MKNIGLTAKASRFASNRGGGLTTLTAVMLTGIVGVGAVAFDIGYWYWDKRAMQSAADAAATTAAWTLADGGTQPQAILAGKASASLNGYSSGDGTTVNVAISGQQATATINRPADLMLSRAIIGNDGFDIASTAVAQVRNSAPVCLLALQGFDSGITENGGSTDVDIWATNCSIQANSSDATALDTNGVNAWISGESVCANYAAPPTGNNIPNATPPAYSCPPLLDPFPNQLAPEWDGTESDCPTQMAVDPVTVEGVTIVFEGCYIDDSIQVNKDLVFQPGGVFYFYNTGIKLAGGQNDTTGSEITILLYGDSTIDLTGSRQMNLSAKPSTDPDFPNILIAADASNVSDLTGGSSADSKLGGSTTSNLEGIIYLPKQDLRVGGTGDLVATEAMIVGNTVTVVGNGSFTITAPTFDQVTRKVVMLVQ